LHYVTVVLDKNNKTYSTSILTYTKLHMNCYLVEASAVHATGPVETARDADVGAHSLSHVT